jgi:hypothetical protein
VLRTFSGRKASQDEGELLSFIDLMRRHGVTAYCEIGARHGDTFHAVMSSLPEKSKGVAVDLPGALWGTEKSRQHLKCVIADLRGRGYEATALFGDSQTDATQRILIGRGPFDAVLIDGDHTYYGARRDWELYRGLAPIVAFHDIVGNGEREKVHGTPVEVPRLWAEIKASGIKTVEFVSPGSVMGIGVCLLA